MLFLRHVLLNDLRHLFRSPLVILMWAGIPFAIGAMVTLMSSGTQLPRAYLLVVDEDESLVSRLLVGALGSGPAEDLIRLESTSRSAGLARIQEGDGSALLLIPPGFGEAVLNETATELTLLTNPAQRILPDLLEAGIQVLVDGTFYLHRIMGDELRLVAAQDTSSAALAQVATTTVRLSQRLKPYLFPPVIDVESAVENQTDVPVTFAFLMLPGMLMMALLFSAQGLGITYWRDRDNGTLRRLASTPTSVTLLLVGKTGAGTVVMALICAVLLAIGMGYHGISFSRFPLALGWLTVSGVVFYLALVLVQLHTPNQRVGTFITNLITLPLLMAGGSFFPMDTMPGWMAAVGRWTPNGYLLNQLQAILLGQSDASTLLMALLLLMVVGGVFFLLCARQNRRIAVIA